MTLNWGANPAQGAETVGLPTLSKAYARFPFQLHRKGRYQRRDFHHQWDGRRVSRRRRLADAGGQRPGLRPDTIALLRQLHSGFWRLPGGNFSFLMELVRRGWRSG